MSEEMRLEWEAWRKFCEELDKVDGGKDAANLARMWPLINAVRVWGERLHALRAGQQPNVIAKALEMALDGRP